MVKKSNWNGDKFYKYFITAKLVGVETSVVMKQKGEIITIHEDKFYKLNKKIKRFAKLMFK